MKHKDMPVTYSPADVEDGTFEAIVSVFNNVDLVKDIVRPGAFAESINLWKSSGDPIPVYWSHRMDDPNYNIGQVEDIRELAGGDSAIPDWANDWVKAHGGLYVKGSIDTHGLAGQVRHLMKTRRVKQFSFAYDVLEERPGKDGTNELLKLWLHEVGPTPLGANPLTELIGAKAAEATEDRPEEIDPDTKRRQSALFSRLKSDIALWQLNLTD